MTATIYFSDSSKENLVIHNLTAITARNVNPRIRDKNYSPKNFHVFTPSDDESYAFVGDKEIVGIPGNRILHVTITDD